MSSASGDAVAQLLSRQVVQMSTYGTKCSRRGGVATARRSGAASVRQPRPAASRPVREFEPDNASPQGRRWPTAISLCEPCSFVVPFRSSAHSREQRPDESKGGGPFPRLCDDGLHQSF